ncbi:hypothetical protein [Paraburkholderia phenoliruptrix]|uniref:hypothetical protein n=1 Tax=Paraburkholderia phenoliruptrix TaxID=252970 RepID=UPI001C6F285C|nr:hypothetical protein [Paraburkholderia phenoliruptrix]MBW9106952.1 hypothetical protein [Paraburkholderia phenoliruptrix]MBW9129404.1 hypothetical protein [Paraburkholderia ginsengiterrae]
MHQRFDFIARPRRQRGQAYAEYLVVTAALIGVLLVATGDTASPLASLVSSFKSLFSAYSFTLSLP